MAGWKDDLSELTENAKIDNRIRNLIWLLLSKYDQQYFRKDPLLTSRDEIYQHLKSNPGAQWEIQSILKSGLLKEEHLDWITNSKWQAAWIQKKVFNAITKPQNKISFNPEIQLHGKAKSIALLDYLMCAENSTIDQQLIHIEELKTRWEEQFKIIRKFEWLSSDPALRHFEKWFGSRMNADFTFNNPEDAQIEINRNNPSKSDLLLLAEQAKKAWNQYQRRLKNKDKKQRNFELSTATINSLEKIAAKYGISRKEVIEIIINAEARDEYHITKILNTRHILINSIDCQ